MKRKNNNRGFTLIELLVVITIIGIITVLALPSVRQLQARNRNTKFEKYKESLKTAGKLYTDSYSVDMFGNSNGCVDIEYSELKGKALIKDYEIDGISCDNPDTFVQVIKESGKYKYNVSLHCTKDTSVRYSKIIPKCDASATGSREPKITVNYVHNKGANGWSQTKKITIKATAPDGLNYPSDIQWGFSKTAGVRPETLKPERFGSTSNPNESVITLDIADMNGIYYLFIDGVNVRDKGGKFAADYWSEELKFDNDVPNITNLSNPKDNTWVGAAGVNDNSYVINVDAADPMSGISYYQYSYPNSTIVKERDWTTYERSQGNHFTTTPFKSERNEYVEIRACDYANNCSSPVKSMIKIDKTNPTCSIEMAGTGSGDSYTSNVTLTLKPSDNGGSAIGKYGLASNNGVNYNDINTGTQGQTNGIVWYGIVQDNAGNEGNCNTGNFKVSLRSIPVFTYSGQYKVVRDNDTVIPVSEHATYTGNWKIRFLTSGTFKITSLNSASNGIDVFLVGGGGSGGGGNIEGNGGGGGGGYSNTIKGLKVTPTSYYITIGDGGPSTHPYVTRGATGGTTSAFGFSVSGGQGGVRAWLGGANGSGGSAVYEFNDSSGIVYARAGWRGGGGAGGTNSGNGGNGGTGGPNTDTYGGAGGSGIVVIRNKR